MRGTGKGGTIPPVADRRRQLARAHRRRRSRRYRSLLWSWARWQLQAAGPRKSRPLPDVAAGQIAVTRVGHATFLLRTPEISILTDPLLTRRCRGVPRLEGCALPEGAADGVDLILLSGSEADHLHRPSLSRLSRSATCVVPRGVAGALASLGFDRVVELAPGHGFNLRGVDVVAAPARAAGDPALSYVIRGGGPTVFFCGVTGFFEGFAEIGREHRPDLALLPIGGYVPRFLRDRHLSPLDAVTAFEDLEARVMIPHRYGAFALSYERLEEPERWLAELIDARELERYVELLEPGESRLFVPPRGRAGTEAGEPRRPLGQAELDEEPDPDAVDISFDDEDGEGGEGGGDGDDGGDAAAQIPG